MNDENNHYRYCFQCDKWKNKTEINEVDLGNGNLTFNCNVCRKDLGDDSQIQIFRCKEHHDEILKVWGVLDGENHEKIFSQECPQKQQQEPNFWERIPLPAKIGGGVITALLGLLAATKFWLSKANKHVEKVEDQLKTVKVEKKEPENEPNII